MRALGTFSLVVGSLVVFAASAGACSDFRADPLEPDRDAGGDASAPSDASGGVDGDANPPGEGGATCGSLGNPCCAGDRCDAPGVCSAGTCTCPDGGCPPEILAANRQSATYMTVTNSHVVFGEESGVGYLTSCLLPGGCPTGSNTLLSGDYVTGVASDGKEAFYDELMGGRVVACSLSGCPGGARPLVTGLSYPRHVAYDGAYVYFSSNDNGTSVMRCAVTGCANTPEIIAQNQTGVFAVAVSNGYVFWTTTGAGGPHVMRCPTNGCVGAPTDMGAGGAGGIAVAGSFVYWTITQSQSVVRCSEAGCGGTPTVIGTSSRPLSLATDGLQVFWRDDITHEIYKCPVTGCPPAQGATIIAYDQHASTLMGIAVDDRFVYWTTLKEVKRLPK